MCKYGSTLPGFELVGKFLQKGFYGPMILPCQDRLIVKLIVLLCGKARQCTARVCHE